MVGAGLALLLAPNRARRHAAELRAKRPEQKDQAAEGLAETGQRAQAQVDAWQEKGQEVTGAISRSKDRVVEAARWPDKD